MPEFLENKYARLWIDQGILFVTYKPGTVLDLRAAIRLTADRVSLQGKKPYPVFVDFRGVKDLTREARDYFAHEGALYISVLGVYATSPLGRLMAYFYVKANAPAIPTGIFPRKKDTLHYVKTTARGDNDPEAIRKQHRISGIYPENFKEQIEHLQAMFLALATGNLQCRMERSYKDDLWEYITVLLNMTTEELEAAFVPREHAQRLYKDYLSGRIAFVLDRHLRIREFHPEVIKALGLDAGTMAGLSFPSLLAKDSLDSWNGMVSQLQKGTDFTIVLHVKTGSGLFLPVSCRVTTLCGAEPGSWQTLSVMFLGTGYDREKKSRHSCNTSPVKKKEPRNNIHLTYADRQVIAKVRTYILHYVDEPLLSIKELAHSCGTNEFKLKHGFRRILGTTVFRFQRDERMKRAKLLVLNTDIPLKDIAGSIGYASSSHFYKAFKKVYGKTPHKFRKCFEGKED
ncbi:helix-turn-helix transcriptional regulator [Sinomicrobium sp. M5D2P17]